MLKKTLQAVLDSGNDYLVAVKGNQPSLLAHLQTFSRHLQSKDIHHSQVIHKGRVEQRTVHVFQAVGLDEMGWPAVQSILWVKRSGLRKHKTYCNEHYYISSVQTSAEQWQALIQGHWGIENRLHWAKDVLFDEDETRLEDSHSLLAWSIIRSFIINILRLSGYQSLKPTLTRLANRLDLIFPLLQ